jgi:hypothetical protein
MNESIERNLDTTGDRACVDAFDNTERLCSPSPVEHQPTG